MDRALYICPDVLRLHALTEDSLCVIFSRSAQLGLTLRHRMHEQSAALIRPATSASSWTFVLPVHGTDVLSSDVAPGYGG